jgi:cytochrome P450
VGELTPQVREITHSLLDPFRQAHTIDVIEDFAAPLSISVLAELLGIPFEKRIAFMELAETQRKDPAGGQIEGISLLFSELIAQRREQPQHDLISTLLTTSVDTSLASETDITGVCNGHASIRQCCSLPSSASRGHRTFASRSRADL